MHAHSSKFIITKKWEKLKCPSPNVVRIYNGILLSHKKNEIMSFVATWIDLEVIILSEVSQTEKDKYMISPICGI